MEDYLKRIGKRIREYRKTQHMNQEALGEKAGLHHTYIGQVERGEKNLTVGSLVRISEALGVAPEQLLSEQAQGEPAFQKVEKGAAADLPKPEKITGMEEQAAKIIAQIIRFYANEVKDE